jgi:hypothetical protein
VIGFVTRSETPVSPERTFAFIVDLTRWHLFRGYAALPGIARAEVEQGAPVQVGARIRVLNTDKSIHHEIVEEFDPGVRYKIRMEVTPPAAYVLRTIEEEVDLEPINGGTQITRTFRVYPRFWFMYPMAWLFGGVFLKRAVIAHNAASAAALAREPA